MKKRILIIIVIIIGSFLYMYYINRDIRDNSNFDIITNNLIKDVINKTIKIQYGKFKEENLDNIFTLEFQNRGGKDLYFYKKSWFYLVDNNYMQSLIMLEDAELRVSVNIEDSKGSYVQIFTLVKENEIYLISNIQTDI